MPVDLHVVATRVAPPPSRDGARTSSAPNRPDASALGASGAAGLAWPSTARSLGIAAALAVQFGVVLACATRQVALTTVGLLAVGVLLGLAAHVDLVEHRIPNRLLSWSAALVLAVAFLAGPDVIDDVALGTTLAFVPVAVVLLARGIGMGDLKMAGVLGAAGGLIHPLVGLATVFLMALTTGIVGIVTRCKRLALGPWLFGAFLVTSTAAAVVLNLRAGTR